MLRERKATTRDEEYAYKTQMTYERTQATDQVPATWDEVQKANDTMLGYRSCTSCDSAVTAGDERSDESSTKVMQKDQVVCVHIRRSGFAEMQSKNRPHDPHDQEHSL